MERVEPEEIQVGPLALRAYRSDLEPAVRPRVLVSGNPLDDPPRWEHIDMSGDDWDQLKQLAVGVTNFVPFTMLLAVFLETASQSGLQDFWAALEQVPAGLQHFRPNDREVHAEARKIVGRLLGLED